MSPPRPLNGRALPRCLISRERVGRRVHGAASPQKLQCWPRDMGSGPYSVRTPRKKISPGSDTIACPRQGNMSPPQSLNGGALPRSLILRERVGRRVHGAASPRKVQRWPRDVGDGPYSVRTPRKKISQGSDTVTCPRQGHMSPPQVQQESPRTRSQGATGVGYRVRVSRGACGVQGNAVPESPLNVHVGPCPRYLWYERFGAAINGSKFRAV